MGTNGVHCVSGEFEEKIVVAVTANKNDVTKSDSGPKILPTVIPIISLYVPGFRASHRAMSECPSEACSFPTTLVTLNIPPPNRTKYPVSRTPNVKPMIDFNPRVIIEMYTANVADPT